MTFTITAHVSATYDGTEVTNIATVTPGINTGCENAQPKCVAKDSFVVPAQLEVAKTHSPQNPIPGQPVTYTVTVTNPSSVTGTGTFTDSLPSQLDAAGATWTCTPSAGSTCGPPPSGTGSPGVPTGVPITVAPNGGTVKFTITATVLVTQSPVIVTNVARVTPNPGTECTDGQPTCKGEDTFTATPETARLTITKGQTPTTPAQGGAITYTVVVTNTSAFTTAHATFDDPVPAQIVADGGWTTTTTGTGTTATPASADGLPHGCHPDHRPARHGDVHDQRPRVGELRRDCGHQHRHRHAGDRTRPVRTASPPARRAVSFANPAKLDGGEDPLDPDESRPSRVSGSPTR